MMNIIDEAYLIPLLPFLGFLINGLGRKVIPKKVTGIIGSGVIFLSFCLSILIFGIVSKEGFTAQHMTYFSFIDIEKLKDSIRISDRPAHLNFPSYYYRRWVFNSCLFYFIHER